MKFWPQNMTQGTSEIKLWSFFFQAVIKSLWMLANKDCAMAIRWLPISMLMRMENGAMQKTAVKTDWGYTLTQIPTRCCIRSRNIKTNEESQLTRILTEVSVVTLKCIWIYEMVFRRHCNIFIYCTNNIFFSRLYLIKLKINSCTKEKLIHYL